MDNMNVQCSSDSLYIKRKVKEILQETPSESPCLDYKQIPYKKGNRCDLIKDVIAMLNSPEALGEDKWIIFGVSDDKKLLGINAAEMRDDNEWRGILSKIEPKPTFLPGILPIGSQTFGYLFVSKENTEWIYRTGETISDRNNNRSKTGKTRKTIPQGKAYIRYGTSNIPLDDKGRENLEQSVFKYRFKRLRDEIKDDLNSKNVLIALALMGSCQKGYYGDERIISELSGLKFNLCKHLLSNIINIHREILAFKDSAWICTNHKNLLSVIAGCIEENTIEAFFKSARSVFSCVSNSSTLFDDNNLVSDNINCSAGLLRGISETIAYMGNNIDRFLYCKKEMLLYHINTYIKSVFSQRNCDFYKSIKEEFVLLGEASPSVFMDQIIELIESGEISFIDFITPEYHDTRCLTGHNYSLGLTLSNIAKCKKYFPKAIKTLFALSRYNGSFLETIANIVNPLLPQTTASPESQVGVIKGIAEKYEDLKWNLLMSLFPSYGLTVTPVKKPRFLEVPDIDMPTANRPLSSITSYIEDACRLIHGKADRACELLDHISTLPSESLVTIIDAINSNSEYFTCEEKNQIWLYAQDAILKIQSHQRRRNMFPGDDAIMRIEEFAEKLVANPEYLKKRLLFRKQQYMLLNPDGSYEEKVSQLSKDQINVLKGIYNHNGLSELLEFVHDLENPEVAGYCSASFLCDHDICNIIDSAQNIKEDSFVKGIVEGLLPERLERIATHRNNEIQAWMRTLQVPTKTCLDRIRELDDDSKDLFWASIDPFNFTFYPDLISEAITEFNKRHHTQKSIKLLSHWLHQQNTIIDPQLVVETLEQIVITQEPCEKYEIHFLILWLQKRDIDKNTIKKIEWKYLTYQDVFDQYQPVNLWNELITNPDFYIYTLRRAYQKDIFFEDEQFDEYRDSGKCMKLIYNCHKAPCITDDGNVDSEQLHKWFLKVTILAEKYNLTEMALYHFGQLSFYAPSDKNGLFINESYAKYLHDENNQPMRDGFLAEAIKSHGSSFASIETFIQIETEYKEKAEKTTERGYSNFSETLFHIAEFFSDNRKWLEQHKKQIDEG